MSHTNIYKKPSKSSLLSSKASLQDHLTTADHQDKSSRSSLHDQSSRSGLHNRSSGTILGLPSLHLSSTEDADVFLENSVENPIQKSKYSNQHSSHQMSSSNDRQHKVFQHISQTENLGSWKLFSEFFFILIVFVIDILHIQITLHLLMNPYSTYKSFSMMY